MLETPRNKSGRAVDGCAVDAAQTTDAQSVEPVAVDTVDSDQAELSRPKEVGGPAGPEPTRYGDWERKGRCIDF